MVANMLHSWLHCIDWTMDPNFAETGGAETPDAADDITGRNLILVKKRSLFLSTKASVLDVEWPVWK